MHMRSSTVLLALALLGLGCHGTRQHPPVSQARVHQPPPNPQEMTSTTGFSGTPHVGMTPAPVTTTNAAAATTPPPSAGTSEPMPNNGAATPPAPPSAPFKPGGEQQPPKSIGGGPNPSTGGAVYGDGNEGNTGAVKGGE